MEGCRQKVVKVLGEKKPVQKGMSEVHSYLVFRDWWSSAGTKLSCWKMDSWSAMESSMGHTPQQHPKQKLWVPDREQNPKPTTNNIEREMMRAALCMANGKFSTQLLIWRQLVRLVQAKGQNPMIKFNTRVEEEEVTAPNNNIIQ